MLMVTVAVLAGVMAELGQRRQRLVRLCIAHHEQAFVCLDGIVICKFGETRQSIDAFYRRQGPKAWRDYQTSLLHSALSRDYGDAAGRPWFPALAGLPPSGGVRNNEALAEWGLEAILEATPLFGTFVLFLTFRTGIPRSERRRGKGEEHSDTVSALG